MYVLGFNGYVFNSAACLVRDGRLVAAAQEERFTREKHTGAFPVNALRYCLREAGIGIDEVDHVAFHWAPWHKFHRRLALVARYLPDSLRYWGSHAGRWANMLMVQRELEGKLPASRRRYEFHRVRHHWCHAASAFLVSPFEEAAILTIDGSGEMASSTMGVGRGSRIDLPEQIHYPHSLGYLYVALTHYLGFRPDSDEYKVMALASLGGPRFYDEFKRIVVLEPEGRYRLDLSYFNYQRGIRSPWVSPKLVERLGAVRREGEPLDERHSDVAWALQRRLEDAVFHMAHHLRERSGLRRLCFAGGTALNSVLNGRLQREAPFDDLFVQPVGNDAGTGIGNAFYVYNAILGRPREYVMDSLYLGPGYSPAECRAALDEAGIAYEQLDEARLVARTAELLVDGKVVGWFQGRMEMGERALGNRSILADPRRAEMKEIINAMVKHREPFRPFAPAVLEEAAADYFVGARRSPYMSFVFPIRPDKRDAIPAVAHSDGTARLQTVARHENPRFWSLIHEFGQRTGVPVVLNTSFNVMGEPIVCGPREAVACFRSTEIDVLVLGDFLVLKSGVGSAAGTPGLRASAADVGGPRGGQGQAA